jgi:hypothetical protein
MAAMPAAVQSPVPTVSLATLETASGPDSSPRATRTELLTAAMVPPATAPKTPIEAIEFVTPGIRLESPPLSNSIFHLPLLAIDGLIFKLNSF